MGIPPAYIKWIRTWLENRRAYIEIQRKRLRWFPIGRGGPQGSSFTSTFSITSHVDMGDFLTEAIWHFFADDLAGRVGVRYTDQCLDLANRLNTFFDQLEFYSILAVQPINYSETQAMWPARAIGYPNPMPDLRCGGHVIEWVRECKYLGYNLTTKLGWRGMLTRFAFKIWQRTAMINSCRISGTSSPSLWCVLFSTFVLPLFTCLFAIFPLITERQQSNLSHLYFTCLKMGYHCLQWEDLIFCVLYQEQPLLDKVSQSTQTEICYRRKWS